MTTEPIYNGILPKRAIFYSFNENNIVKFALLKREPKYFKSINLRKL